MQRPLNPQTVRKEGLMETVIRRRAIFLYYETAVCGGVGQHLSAIIDDFQPASLFIPPELLVIDLIPLRNGNFHICQNLSAVCVKDTKPVVAEEHNRLPILAEPGFVMLVSAVIGEQQLLLSIRTFQKMQCRLVTGCSQRKIAGNIKKTVWLLTLPCTQLVSSSFKN